MNGLRDLTGGNQDALAEHSSISLVFSEIIIEGTTVKTWIS